MAAQTPMLKGEDALAPLASRFVRVDDIPWKPTPCDGVEMKILVEDPATGLMTALFKWAPGATLPMHEHTALEQTYVLEGSIRDAEGEVTAGNFVWRPEGNRHAATAPDGALVLGMFLKPNKFLEGELAGAELK